MVTPLYDGNILSFRREEAVCRTNRTQATNTTNWSCVVSKVTYSVLLWYHLVTMVTSGNCSISILQLGMSIMLCLLVLINHWETWNLQPRLSSLPRY